MIPKEFTKTSAINDKLKKIIDSVTENWLVDDIKWDIWEFEIQTNEDTGRPYKHDIAETYDIEYNDLVNKEVYFFGCPFSIYKKSYSARLNHYLEENKLDLYTELHFIKKELNSLNKIPLVHYLNYTTIQKVSKSIARQKEFLLDKKIKCAKAVLEAPLNIDRLEDEGNKQEANPFPRIFISTNAYLLFEGFREHIREKYHLADYSFIYRKMRQERLIYEAIGDSEFTRFLSDEYKVELEKTKQLNNCSTSFKLKTYQGLKNLNKPY
jgi:hypothetical protein